MQPQVSLKRFAQTYLSLSFPPVSVSVVFMQRVRLFRPRASMAAGWNEFILHLCKYRLSSEIELKASTSCFNLFTLICYPCAQILVCSFVCLLIIAWHDCKAHLSTGMRKERNWKVLFNYHLFNLNNEIKYRASKVLPLFFLLLLLFHPTAKREKKERKKKSLTAKCKWAWKLLRC